MLYPTTTKPVASWEGLKGKKEKKKSRFPCKPGFVSALRMSPQANPYLPNALTGKEQKSLVGKEEINCNLSGGVGMFSQLRPLFTN